MSATAVFEERADPGAAASAALSAVMHLILLAVLIFGLSWRNRPPEAVEVELWLPPPPVAVVETPKPEPSPKLEPPKVESVPPKPEPVIPKPDIVEKAAPEKAKPVPKPAPKVEPKPLPPKPVAKVEQKPPPPKPVAKAEPLRPRVEETQRRMREEVAREQAAIAVDRELKDQLAREAGAARQRGLAEYEAKIRNKVRGNIILPPDLQGNPEVVLLVVQLPTGEVLSARLVKSSGHRAYDESVERAILKSSPLPKPDKPELFSRELRLTFRPRD